MYPDGRRRELDGGRPYLYCRKDLIYKENPFTSTVRDRLAPTNPLGEPGNDERSYYHCTFEHYVNRGPNLVCLGYECGSEDRVSHNS